MLYLDSSALVKLVRPEPEADALRAYLAAADGLPRVTSALARVELLQVVARSSADRRNDALEALARCEQLALTDHLLEEAADIGPPTLRSLEAIHLASARRLPPELTSVVTYDLAMLGAAATLDLPTASPV